MTVQFRTRVNSLDKVPILVTGLCFPCPNIDRKYASADAAGTESSGSVPDADSSVRITSLATVSLLWLA
ncbi:MAG: hypothetical protein KDA96_02130 [Planctomycetaceae bacterium]|nr:hypothetical protein [Planctomycetaceae bacterium]